MTYIIRVDKRPTKFIAGLSDAKLKARLNQAIVNLGDEPRPVGCTKLEASADIYRIRVGDYRIVYQIKDTALIILVVAVGHRREVYR